MSEVELEQLKESIERLETKMDTSLAQQRRPRFLWKEFWIGFGVVAAIIFVYSVTARILHG